MVQAHRTAPQTVACPDGCASRLLKTARFFSGVNRVELLVNGKVVAKDVTAGYRFAINTKKYGKKIRIQLRAYDRADNHTVTSTRTWHR